MKKHKIRSRIINIILIAILVAGVCVLCYPSFSNWWNSRTMSRAVSDYDEAVANMSEKDYTKYFEDAEAYNEGIYEMGTMKALLNPDQVQDIDGLEYNDLLDVTGDGIMGYITIDKINVELPIYHGTDANVLASGAGHLEGSTLPIGGESRHCVISAHRGLPSALLFTDLDQMEEGDTFAVTVLDQTYTYEVDQISIILPNEYEDLYIEEGEDYCTLMTCTPYGINTHRLLVRGVRTDNGKHLKVLADAVRLDPIMVAPFIAIPFLVILLIWLLVSTRRNKKKTLLGDKS